MATDDDLLAAWRAGDVRAGDAFVRRMFEPIRRFFASKVASEVEELVQRTFTRLAEAQARFQGRSSARAFVFGVARNVLREHYRGKHRKDVDVEELPVRDMAPGPSTLRWRRKEDERMLEGLRGLPLHMQIALELFYWDDLTMREIAEVLEIPEGTVASRLVRARARLREGVDGVAAANPGGSSDDADPTLDAWSDRIRGTVPVADRQA